MNKQVTLQIKNIKIFNKQTYSIQVIYSIARHLSRSQGLFKIHTGHLLTALISDPKGLAGEVLRNKFGLTQPKVKRIIRELYKDLPRLQIKKQRIHIRLIKTIIRISFLNKITAFKNFCEVTVLPYRESTFSSQLSRIIYNAGTECIGFQQIFVDSEHLLLAILLESNGSAIMILHELGIDPIMIRKELLLAMIKETEHPLPFNIPVANIPMHPATKFENKSKSTNLVYLNKLVSFDIDEEKKKYQENLNLSIKRINEKPDLLYLEPDWLRPGKRRKFNITDTLYLKYNKYAKKKLDIEAEVKKYDFKIDIEFLNSMTTNMTQMAINGEIEAVFGREDELTKVIKILSRRRKNNPLLLGEPGVGKTALVESLALKIVNNNVPESLLGKIILNLPLLELTVDDGMPGSFETKMTNLINAVKNNSRLIILLDEIHTLVGSGNSEGSLDASQILKPPLARGEFQCIGATTNEEYEKYFKTDPALDRRFQKVNIPELNENESKKMLYSIAHKYQTHHSVIVSKSALDACVTLSIKHITNRFLPDKALDLLDETCSYIHLLNQKIPEEIRDCEIEIYKLNELKTKAFIEKNYNEALKCIDDIIKFHAIFELILNDFIYKYECLNRSWASEGIKKRYSLILKGPISILKDKRFCLKQLEKNNNKNKKIINTKQELKDNLSNEYTQIKKNNKILRILDKTKLYFKNDINKFAQMTVFNIFNDNFDYSETINFIKLLKLKYKTNSIKDIIFFVIKRLLIPSQNAINQEYYFMFIAKYSSPCFETKSRQILDSLDERIDVIKYYAYKTLDKSLFLNTTLSKKIEYPVLAITINNNIFNNYLIKPENYYILPKLDSTDIILLNQNSHKIINTIYSLKNFNDLSWVIIVNIINSFNYIDLNVHYSYPNYLNRNYEFKNIINKKKNNEYLKKKHQNRLNLFNKLKKLYTIQFQKQLFQKQENLDNRYQQKNNNLVIKANDLQKIRINKIVNEYNKSKRSWNQPDIKYVKFKKNNSNYMNIESKLSKDGNLPMEEILAATETDYNSLPIVSESDVAYTISVWMDTFVEGVKKDKKSEALDADNELTKNVIGQSNAINGIIRALRRARVGISDAKKPIASFLFCGPTGVGKTEVTRSLAKYYFGGEQNMVRFDMSDFMESGSISKLIGAPPGYIGHDKDGLLTGAIKKNPHSLVLFDEVEKAHPDIFNIFLQILDDGRLSDSTGNIIDFTDTIIIMTSNLGASAISKSYNELNNEKTNIDTIKPFVKKKVVPNELPFIYSDNNPELNAIIDDILYEEDDNSKPKYTQEELIAVHVSEALQEFFRPEFLNRIGEIILFSSLNKNDIYKIASLSIKKLILRLKEKNYNLVLDDYALTAISEEGYDPAYGARPLRRAISKYIEDPVSLLILNEKIPKYSTITITYQNLNYKFDWKPETLKKRNIENINFNDKNEKSVITSNLKLVQKNKLLQKKKYFIKKYNKYVSITKKSENTQFKFVKMDDWLIGSKFRRFLYPEFNTFYKKKKLKHFMNVYKNYLF